MPDLTSLNEEQRQAVTHGTGPLLIIAGAGTGKTTVVTKRIEHLILDEKIPPSNILALTFTEKAAQEMETRIDEILPYGYTTLWIETFHAFCDRILRQEAINIGLNPRFDLLTEAESLLFLRKHLFEFKLDYFRPLGNPTKFLQGMLTHFSRLKDDDITPKQYLEFADKHTGDDDEVKKTRELAHAFEFYENLKAKEGVMDYSDLISNTLKVFRDRPSVLKQYQKQFQYVFVDEFQDTNYAQNEMAILLAGERKNITVVGDDDQSIYRWRGAAIANMMQFREHFPQAKIVTLNKNYRSTQKVLDGAYTLIQNNNPDRLEIKEKIDKKLTAMREIKGEDIEFIYANRGEDEAEMVAKAIQADIKKTRRAYNDYAILVRANDHSTPFQRALERLHIPYQFLGPGHLFQQDEIKDLIAYLHVLTNFNDMSSLYRIITMQVFGIQARDVASILNFAKQSNFSLFEAMEQVEKSSLTEDGKEKIQRITEMIKNHLEKVPRVDAGQILYYFFEDSGLLGYYLDPGSAKTEKEAQNIAKFFEKLQSFSANHTDASVFTVTDWLDLAVELGESPQAAEIDWTRNNAVNILTIHASKGLEFPVVFVVNLVSQRFPSRDRKEQIPVPTDLIRETLPEGEEGLQEERRLFYVAITRAQDKLFLTASRFYNEGKRERKISPFVIETIGESTIQAQVKKQTAEPPGQQLSLLEVLNSNINPTKPETREKSKEELFDITYISYSQLQTFRSCPLHYKLKYILKLPSPPSAALSYGISVHSVLRDFALMLQDKQPIKEETIKELIERNWINQGFASKSHEQQTYQQAEEMLLRFSKETLTTPPNTVAIEMPFNFWLDRLKVGGRIDRIDALPDGRIEIVDYKTGKNVPTEKKAREDLQLSFYGLAATEITDGILGKDPKDVLLTLHYLEDNIKISTTRTRDDLEKAKEEIVSIVGQIQTSDFSCNHSMLCKSCEYQMLCQIDKR
ncbi:MAG TPA: ATP-dependent DNA helicase [Candidatus Saccharimonadales bacterium]|nr:ATP-dependent DNA helicase [Candidatus Saccharimonadales bacterium]